MDSDNILSILASLGQTSANQGIVPITYRPVPTPGDEPYSLPPQPNNVLQAAMAPPPAPAPVPTPAPAPAPAEHPRKRLSVIDTIGRLADVVARVGGADALYQPTLDARQDRLTKVDMDALQKRLTVAQVGDAELSPVLAARKRMGTALGALANNPDAAALWPSVAEQAGISDPQQVAAIGTILQNNPGSAGIFAKALGADIDNLGKNVYFGTGPNGKTVAYQVGPDGNPHILDFSASGVTPSDPIKVVDTGGAQVIVGSSGNPRRILPKGVSPDRAHADATAITIAGMPARAATGKAAGDNSAFIQTAQGNLDELRRIYGNLKKMGAMVSTSQSAGQNIEARSRASGLGQTVEGYLGTNAQTQRDRINSIRPGLMQSLAKATGMTGKQLDSNADVKLFMQTVTDPSKSYEANMQAIAGLERFLKANAKKPTVTPVNTPAARPAGNSGWGKATVVEG